MARITIKENLLGTKELEKPYFSQTMSGRKKKDEAALQPSAMEQTDRPLTHLEDPQGWCFIL
jgi:hypothetical protein